MSVSRDFLVTTRRSNITASSLSNIIDVQSPVVTQLLMALAPDHAAAQSTAPADVLPDETAEWLMRQFVAEFRAGLYTYRDGKSAALIVVYVALFIASVVGNVAVLTFNVAVLTLNVAVLTLSVVVLTVNVAVVTLNVAVLAFNVAVLTLVLPFRRMRSVTHYFIINLAVADLLRTSHRRLLTSLHVR